MNEMNKIASLPYMKKWLIVASLLGIVSGISALAFYYAIIAVEHIFLGSFVGMNIPRPAGEGGISSFVYDVKNFWYIPVSIIIGGILSGAIVYKFAPEAEGHGTDAAIKSFHYDQGKIRRRIPLVKGIASAITIGSGGSAGREGPTAQISAGIGSFIADTIGLSDNDRRMAVAVCIGAGIGTIFKAPIGGAILAAEVLYKRDLETEVIYPSIIASAIGYSIFGSVVGFTPIFGYNLVPFSVLRLPMYAILGIVTGLLAILYIKTFYGIHEFFNKLRISRYAKPAMGAFVVGILALFFPEIMATGYGWVQILMNGSLQQIPTFGAPLLLMLILLPFVKIVATSFSIGSGGSGGVFAPGIEIGASAGLLTFLMFHAISPSLAAIAVPFVIIGMLSFFGAAGKAPISVLIMVVEMTGSLQLLPGAMIAVLIAYFVSGDNTIYRSQVPTRKDSPVHFGEYNVPMLTGMTIEGIGLHDISITPNSTVSSVTRKMKAEGLASLPVVEKGGLIGVVYLLDINNTNGSERIRALMRTGSTYLRLQNTADEAWEVMVKNKSTWVPVVEKGRYLGVVTLDSMLKRYKGKIASLRRNQKQARTPPNPK